MTFLKRILLVDNEPRVTRLVRLALEGSGKYLVREAANSSMALRTARWFRPDVILLDVASGGLTCDAARYIQADVALKDTPVMLLAGFGCSDEVISGGVFHGFSFVAEPVRIAEVVRCVDEMLRDDRISTAAA
jgi:DNA-binding response OmpR family regulator